MAGIAVEMQRGGPCAWYSVGRPRLSTSFQIAGCPGYRIWPWGNQIRPWAGTEHKAGRGPLSKRRLDRRVCLRTWSAWLDMTTISQLRGPRRVPDRPDHHSGHPLSSVSICWCCWCGCCRHDDRSTVHRCSVPSWACLRLGPRRLRCRLHGAQPRCGGESTRSEGRCRGGQVSSSGEADCLQLQELVPLRPVDQRCMVIGLEGGLVGWTRSDERTK